jgi:hypothetical protein
MSTPALNWVTLPAVLLCAGSCQSQLRPVPFDQSHRRNEAYGLVLKDATAHVSTRIRVYEQVREWRGPAGDNAPFVPASVYRKGTVIDRIQRADSIGGTLGTLPRAHGVQPSGLWGAGPLLVRVLEQLPVTSRDSLQLVVVLDAGTPIEITWYRVVRKADIWRAQRTGHFEF